MPAASPAKMARFHFCERDRYRGKPLHEAIVETCREFEIAGATVYRGIEGYGEAAEIHRGGMMAHEAPIVVTVVDTAENVARLLPAVEAMIGNGMIAVSEVEMVRIRKAPRE